MFDIEYKGGNSVIITTKGLKLVADPKLSLLGLKDLGTKDMVALATEPRFFAGESEARLAIEGPGEYEIGDFSIRGIPATRHIDVESEKSGTTIYRIDIGEVSIALLGNIAGKLNEEQLEAIGVVDIVILPVGGGGYTLDGSSATRLVREIDPKVIIPIHYADTHLNYEVPQDALDMFISLLGAPVETTDKYKLKAAAMLPTVMTVVEIKRT
jgi:L-ascorbate metabolism protein UlaG (beta-lactamase superfamily)